MLYVLQMHRRKTQARLPIQGNFYPMTTAAFIEDTLSRMTLLSAQSHGVAAVQQGTEYYHVCQLLQIISVKRKCFRGTVVA